MHGLKKFREYFADCDFFYVIIGGTACSILFEEVELAFRSTKDIDLVIISESLDFASGTLIGEFIKDGGYQAWVRKDQTSCRYRFAHPTNDDFPAIIELFSKQPAVDDSSEIGVLELPDDLSNFSAILLHQEVYDFIRGRAQTHEGIWIMEAAELIALKAVAWTDNRDRIDRGEIVKSDDVKKHLGDILKLLGIVDPRSRVLIPNGLMTSSIRRLISFMETEEFTRSYALSIDVSRYLLLVKSLFPLDPS